MNRKLFFIPVAVAGLLLLSCGQGDLWTPDGSVIDEHLLTPLSDRDCSNYGLPAGCVLDDLYNIDPIDPVEPGNITSSSDDVSSEEESSSSSDELSSGDDTSSEASSSSSDTGDDPYDPVSSSSSQTVVSSSSSAPSSSSSAPSSSSVAPSSSSSTTGTGGLCDGKPNFVAEVNYAAEGYQAVYQGSLWTCQSVPHFCTVGSGHNPGSYSWTNLGPCD